MGYIAIIALVVMAYAFYALHQAGREPVKKKLLNYSGKYSLIDPYTANVYNFEGTLKTRRKEWISSRSWISISIYEVKDNKGYIAEIKEDLGGGYVFHAKDREDLSAQLDREFPRNGIEIGKPVYFGAAASEVMRAFLLGTNWILTKNVNI